MSKTSSFKNLINGDTPVFIDFHALWCGPCKAMNPIIKELAKDNSAKLRVIKIDIDKNQALSKQLGIRGVPTFVLYKNGQQLWRQSGMLTKVELEKQLKTHLAM